MQVGRIEFGPAISIRQLRAPSRVECELALGDLISSFGLSGADALPEPCFDIDELHQRNAALVRKQLTRE
jgi:hypothetical protein